MHTHTHQLQETDKALEVFTKPFAQWHSVLHDQWNVAGILGGINYGADGMPFITSHYGYYMSSWHVVMALTGQKANMTDHERSLTFAPRLDPPYSLPVHLPAVWGYLKADLNINSSIRIEFGLEFGSLNLTYLAVHGCELWHPDLLLTMSSSKRVTWLCSLDYQ